MKVFYLGGEDASYVLSKIIKRRGDELVCDFVNTSIYAAKNRIINEAPDYVFIDLAAINSEESLIFETIENIKNVMQCTFVIVALKYTLRMEIISSFITELDIRAFVLNSSLKKQEKEIEDILAKGFSVTSEYREQLIKEKEKREKEIYEAVPESKPIIKAVDKKKIAIIGEFDRVGVTTAAMQLVKYLAAHGKEACYIERNKTGYLDALKTAFVDWSEDETKGKIEYENTDLFYPVNINATLQENYEYYIYDYGSYKDADLVSVLEQDVVICVCDISPAGFINMRDLYAQLFKHKSVFYLFNFCHTKDRPEILKLQASKKDMTFFLEFSPDPYFYNPENDTAFEKIMEMSMGSKNVFKEKKSFLRR